MLWGAHQHLQFAKTQAALTSGFGVLGPAVSCHPLASGVREVFCDAGPAVFAASEQVRGLCQRR